jgi:hypothetical protein
LVGVNANTVTEFRGLDICAFELAAHLYYQLSKSGKYQGNHVARPSRGT